MFLTMSLCILLPALPFMVGSVHSSIFIVLGMTPAGVRSLEKKPVGFHKLCKLGWVGGYLWRPVALKKSVIICDLPSDFPPLVLFSEIWLFVSQRIGWNNLFVQPLVLRTHCKPGVGTRQLERANGTDCPRGSGGCHLEGETVTAPRF